MQIAYHPLLSLSVRLSINLLAFFDDQSHSPKVHFGFSAARLHSSSEFEDFGIRSPSFRWIIEVYKSVNPSDFSLPLGYVGFVRFAVPFLFHVLLAVFEAHLTFKFRVCGISHADWRFISKAATTHFGVVLAEPSFISSQTPFID